MATRRVRFEFYCDGAPDSLKFTHEVPEDLVTTRAQAQQDVEYQGRFGSALVPIVKEHEATCRAASSPFCGICGSPVATVLQTPMSFLDKAEDPFVGVLVSGLCGKGECEIQTRRDVQEMSEVGAKSQTCVEITTCKVCGKTEGMMRCGRCKVIAYCGKEHQKQDWKIHKRICTPKSEESVL
ncbi:hypothetical protein RB595_007946 [Gaeumannomyces hyphopodioides]